MRNDNPHHPEFFQHQYETNYQGPRFRYFPLPNGYPKVNNRDSIRLTSKGKEITKMAFKTMIKTLCVLGLAVTVILTIGI